jgi:Domain of unknown function (DUF5047)
MYPTSTAYKAAILKNHTVVAKAEVWSDDRKLLDLSFDTGKVSVSTTNTIRRTCEIHLTTTRTTTNLVPNTGFDYLAPFGNQLRLFRGIQFDNGTTEYIPLGVFVITEVKVTDTNEGVSMTVRGEDKSIIVSRNKWTTAYQMLSGTLEDSLKAVLQNRYPDIKTDFPITNITVNQIILGSDSNVDPWKDVVGIAQLVGYDLYFDVRGVCTMRQFPTLDAGSVVATYKEGSGTTITSIDRNISTKETYNGVIYTIEGSQVTTPIRVEVWDEDTTSPTYRYGVFGSVPTFITSNILSSQTDAIKAATLLLNNYIGAQEQISFTSLVDPSLDVNDVIYVKSIGSRVDRTVIIDTMDIPLEYTGALNVSTRVVRVVGANEIVAVGTV